MTSVLSVVLPGGTAVVSSLSAAVLSSVAMWNKKDLKNKPN